MTLDPAIRSFYNRRPEEDRLETGRSQLEAVRTREIIKRFAPPPPGVVVDVGGAAGAYAIPLAAIGYEVHLLDPVRRLVREGARRSAEALSPFASCAVADARDLPLRSAAADVALVFGPLYHLTTAVDRDQAWRNAARIVKSGGVVFAAGITRWASAFQGLVLDRLADPDFRAIVEQDLRDGQHRNPGDVPEYFTTAYFHRPEELEREAEAAGLVVEALLGVEGPGCLLADIAERWANPRQRSDIVHIAQVVESEPSLRGLSAHLMVVARKP